MGANYSFYVKTIETHARAFFNVIIFSIGSVFGEKLKFGLVLGRLIVKKKEMGRLMKAFFMFSWQKKVKIFIKEYSSLCTKFNFSS